MAFLTINDFKSRVYQEKIDAISEGDTALLPEAITAAIAEAKLYLSRFDLDDLFGKTGVDRDPILLVWCKDISLWQFIGLSNPGIDYEDCQIRRNNAIKSLKEIQTSSAVPIGWKLLALDANGNDPSTSMHVSSNPKRNTYR